MGSQQQHFLTMKYFILLAIFCSSLAIATPRLNLFAPEDAAGDAKLGCSIQQLIDCASEIQTALDDCGHLTDTSSIVDCINISSLPRIARPACVMSSPSCAELQHRLSVLELFGINIGNRIVFQSNAAHS